MNTLSEPPTKSEALIPKGVRRLTIGLTWGWLGLSVYRDWTRPILLGIPLGVVILVYVFPYIQSLTLRTPFGDIKVKLAYQRTYGIGLVHERTSLDQNEVASEFQEQDEVVAE